MNEFPYHQCLRLQNFTAFQDTTFEFVPGINVLVGENGTGKTHVLKVLYAWQMANHLSMGTSLGEIINSLIETFSIKDTLELSRNSTQSALIIGKLDDSRWTIEISPNGGTSGSLPDLKPSRPVFIPAIDLMGHTKNMLGTMQDYADFDRTCFDFLKVVITEQLRGDLNGSIPALIRLQKIMPGTVEWSDFEQRFYLIEKERRLPFPLVAEGVRKIAGLHRLIQNGWLKPGTVLFWDEPEVNINPQWMDEIVGTLVLLAQSGVQIFLATHSYIMLKEIEVQSRKSDTLRYFALTRTEEGVTVNPADSYLEINPNPIEQQYADLYDRSIAKRLKGDAR